MWCWKLCDFLAPAIIHSANAFSPQGETMTAPAQDLTALQYPIGKFSFAGPLTPQQRAQCIEDIAAAPKTIRAAVKGLSPEQIETPYRDGGWTVRQVLHHVPESHMNAFLRFKWALTEDTPTVKAYKESEWAKTPEVAKTSVETSLVLLGALHERWVNLLRSMTAEDFARKLNHSENGEMTVDKLLALYAWHGKHHVAHITSLRKRKGWN